MTAGNAQPVNDGAAATVVMSGDRVKAMNVKPLARIVAQATSGLAPKMLLMTPVEATRKVLKKAGWSLNDVDLGELNEACAVQAVGSSAAWRRCAWVAETAWRWRSRRFKSLPASRLSLASALER